jgi:hypothetical protein
MKKRKRISVRVIDFYGLAIPLDLCWAEGLHRYSYKHVHNLQRQDDMRDDSYANVKKIIDSGRKQKWCRECVIEYPLHTADSRAFYEVVRLNHNEFTGNLPMEIILMIYKHLLRKPLLFTECSELESTEPNHHHP